MSRSFNMIENYIYLFHLTDEQGVGKFIILPTYPESITDTMQASFNSTAPLARSAPIFTYSHSGPRTIQVTLKFHREMMTQINYGVSNLNVEVGDDYVDTIIKLLQTMAVPKYAAAEKMVNPPLIALRFGNEIYIKGIVEGGVTVSYDLPLLENNKYAQVSVSFTVSEVDPYDAEGVAQQGSFRGLSRSLERKLWKR